ncbi:TPA: hypothetical protein DCX16_01700 [bacterium]|nr:hypothetical protein [bacterium]
MLFIKFLGLLLVVTFASYILSLGAEGYTKKYGANLVGSIFLALIGTLPEYMFVIWASLKGNYGVAIGSTIGACTLLITLGYGSVILFATTRVSKKPVHVISLSHQTRIDAIYLSITAIIALFLVWEGGSLDLKDGIILVAIFVAYVIQTTLHSFASFKPEKENISLKKGSLLLITGGAIVFFASHPFVDTMIEVSHKLGINPVTIAILIGPIASEIPEKLTAYITVIRNGALAEISVCNFIGTKVNHNSLLIGTLAIIGFLKGDSPVTGMLSIPFLMMTILTLFATLNILTGRLTKLQGIIFTLFYFLVIFIAFKGL